MKKIFLLLLISALCLPACAQQSSEEKSASAGQTVQDPAERNKMLYSLGFLLGDNLKTQLILDNEADYKAVSQGMRDSLLGKSSQTDLDKYKPQIVAKYKQDAQVISERHAAEQKEFLENFAKEKGVKTLDNGAMIKLSKKGKGRSPSASSTVKVHYEGKLTDGTKFDSSYDRGEAFTVPLTSVISCWTKGVQQMRPGAEATLVCPADTAYGNRPVGTIPPNSVLVFKIELLEVND